MRITFLQGVKFSPPPRPRPALQSVNGVTVTRNRSEDSKHIHELRNQLGEHLVSYLAGEGTVRDVRRWAAGTSAPSDDVAARLRLAHDLLESLRTASPERDAVATFEQPLPQLGGYSTARLLRDARLEQIRPLIFTALALPVVERH